MNSLYTDEVKQIVRLPQWPDTLAMEVVEYDTHLGLRLFRDNFETFDGVEKEVIAKTIGDVILKVRALGVPMYLEVARGHGPAIFQERIV